MIKPKVFNWNASGTGFAFFCASCKAMMGFSLGLFTEWATDVDVARQIVPWLGNWSWVRMGIWPCASFYLQSPRFQEEKGMIGDDCTKRRRSVPKAQWPDDQKSVLALSSPFLLQPTTTSSVSPVLKQRTKANIRNTNLQQRRVGHGNCSFV